MRHSSVGFALGVLALAGGVRAEAPKDAQAEKALKQALDEDYLETRFDDADQRLRTAIQGCGRDGCSPKVLARLHAALGSVLAGGKKQLEDAREAFVDALKIDPKVEPHPDIVSSEATFAFEKAKAHLKLGAGASKPAADPALPKGRGKGAACASDAACDAGLACVGGACAAPKAPEPAIAARKNWISLSFVPDVSIVSGDDVCTANAQKHDGYVCLRGNRTRYVGTPTLGNADNINTGLALSTLRILVGYDRLVLDNLTVGTRVGFAFNGAGDGGASFIPVHLEARATLWPGSRPFEGGRLLRPSIFLSAGLAQIDSKVDVEVLENGETCGAANPSNTSSKCTKRSRDGVLEDRRQTLVTYKQAGPGFASIGGGLDFVPTRMIALHLGVRASVTFPVVTAVLSPEGGLAVGF